METRELINNITKITGDNPPYLEEVMKHFCILNLQRNQYLISEGDICKHVYYVQSGLIQVFQIDKNFNERTIDLILPDNWFTDLESFKNKSNSKLSARATKDTIVYQIKRESFDLLLNKVPKFAEVYIRIIEEKYKESNERILAFSSLNAQEKINWLRKFKPEFFNSLSDKLIADYLGISKETFCRQKQFIGVDNCQ